MLHGTIASDTGTDVTGHAVHAGASGWRELHAQLCSLAKRRAELDVEEAACLIRARRSDLHRRLGMGSFREYMEEVLGYGPRVGQDRLRVAEALELFPQIRAAFAVGELTHSAVRELARVVVPETADEWLGAARGKRSRELEQLVSGLQKGDRPTDVPNPALVRKILRAEVSGATLALFREVRRALEDEAGHALDDDTLITTLCRRAVEPGTANGPARAPFQIAVTRCEHCNRAWQDGAGQVIEIAPAALEIAECDAERIGSLDAATPQPVEKDVPTRVRRLVWRRDHGKCVVPGCRASRGLDLHHVVPREAGGGHTPDNLCLLCSGHHHALHADRTLTITGQAPALEITMHGATPPAAETAPPGEHDAEVRTALVRMGYRGHEARLAVDRARAHVGGSSTLDELLEAAVREVPKPRAG